MRTGYEISCDPRSRSPGPEEIFLGNQSGLRADLRLSSADADDAGAAHPLFARIRHHRSRSCDDHAVAPPSRPIATASATGARVSSPPPGGSGSRARPWSGTPASPTSSHPSRNNIQSRSCPRSRWFFCWEADTATPRNCPRWPGACSETRPWAGAGSRPSAISCTTISRSAMSTPAPQGRPGRHTTSAEASAAITPISPSHSAGA